MQHDLLFEIGTEELPARLISHLVKQLEQRVIRLLGDLGLSFSGSQVYATPRRLAVWVKSIPVCLAEQQVEKFGPYMDAALNQQNEPTAAARGFARACGVDFADLARYQDKRGERLYFQQIIPGRQTIDLLPQILAEAIQGLNLSQKMYWGDHKQAFVRPVCWLLALFGEQVVPLIAFDISADRLTYGHKFHSKHALNLQNPSEYLVVLRANKVIADADERRALIRHEAEKIAQQKAAKLVVSPALLEEVSYLVEWPVVLFGSFEQRFLQVPQEALISAMVKNQKYFHLVDQNNRLLPYFITVSNIESRDPEQVRLGNERVLRPRLADAEFFYQTDQKHRLTELRQQLKQLIFIKGLGSVYDKTLRLEHLALHVAQRVSADLSIDLAALKRAAQLAKSDLLTAMVQEFPDLQGVMGTYYARLQGEGEQVAQAIQEHYLPRFAEDNLAESAEGVVLAIADKLDSLVGLCIADKMPTGDKDPFALRRSAIGILRMILTKKLKLDLSDLIGCSLADYQATGLMTSDPKDMLAKLLDFFYQRAKAYYKEQQGEMAVDAFTAINAALIRRPLDFHQRMITLQNFMKHPEAGALVVAAKRIHNILYKQATGFVATFQPDMAKQEAEHKLYRQLMQVDQQLTELLRLEYADYAHVTHEFILLTPVINAFFDQVMVMHEDMLIRNNRLALLAEAYRILTCFADLSSLSGST